MGGGFVVSRHQTPPSRLPHPLFSASPLHPQNPNPVLAISCEREKEGVAAATTLATVVDSNHRGCAGDAVTQETRNPRLLCPPSPPLLLLVKPS